MDAPAGSRESPVTRSFEFDFDRRFAPLLALIGATRGNSRVEVRGDRLVVHLGPWGLSVPLGSIKGFTITGPYRWYRALGVRLSLVDRGLTFGTNARRGLCIRLDPPVRSALRIDHPGLTLTVADPQGLRGAIEAHPARAASQPSTGQPGDRPDGA